MAAMRADLSQRIEVLRVVCILGVVVVHTAPPEDFGQAFFAPWAKFVHVFFAGGFFRAGLPTLSVISGYLAVLALQHSTYRTVVGKRWWSLLVPAVLWGVLTAVPALALQYTGALSANTFEMVGGGVRVWIDAIFGLDQGPINKSLYFLYDLFLCLVALPLFVVVLRRAALAGGVVLLAVLAVDPLGGAYLRPEIVLGFYAGGYVAMHGLDPVRLDRWRRPCLAVYLAACAAVAWYGTGLPPGALEDGLRPLINGLRVIGPLAMWALVSYLIGFGAGARLARFGKHAFFLYCFHSPVMRLIARAWYASDHRFPPEAYLLYFALAAPVAVALALVAAEVLARTAGGALYILSGTRLGARPAPA